MAADLPDKTAVVACIQAELGTELEAFERVAAATRSEVGSDETRQEGQYDTRATEASYLARGQARRIAQLRRVMAWLEAFDPSLPLEPALVQVGALVALDGHRRELLFVAPVGGGRVQVGPHTVQIVSPSGPMGRAMAELELGDGFEVDSPRGVLDYEIVALG
jgi:transcription elongation GreA/GreB family factor